MYLASIIRRLCIGAGLCLAITPASAQLQCTDTPEGRICKVQQPIVSGAPVPMATQRDLGLVTVGGGCSGTLINRYWVLTADHCTSGNGAINGTVLDPSLMTITATWSAERVVPTRFVRNWGGGGLDMALIYLGAGDFGTVNIQLLALDPRQAGDTLVKYGQGLSVYAQPGPPQVPASGIGQYRTATFTISAISPTTYTLPSNAAGQVGNGGDSGGPDVLLGPNGVGLGIAGVQSTCGGATSLPGRNLPTVPPTPLNWSWVNSIASCNSAPIADVRFDILQIIQEVPADLTAVLHELLWPGPRPIPFGDTVTDRPHRTVIDPATKLKPSDTIRSTRHRTVIDK